MRQFRAASLAPVWLVIVCVGILYVFGLGFLQFLDQVDKSAVAGALLVLWWVALLGLLYAAHREP